MSYTYEDFYRDFTKDHLDKLTPEERLKGLSIDDLFKVFSVEEILKVLSTEELVQKLLEKVSPEELEMYLKRPKSPEGEAAAKEAIAKVMDYGKLQLEQAEASAKAGDYYEGAEILFAVEKTFKGSEIADKADDTLDAWKRDASIKKELDGGVVLKRAEAYADAGNVRGAAGLLLQLTKQSKYEGTRVRDVAAKRRWASEAPRKNGGR